MGASLTSPKRDNLLAALPARLSEERIDELVSAPGIRIERIVSTGQHSPDGFWYDQRRDEWVVVLKGRARLEIDGQEELIEMDVGDHLLLPARCRHRVAWTTESEPTVWLAVHFDHG